MLPEYKKLGTGTSFTPLLAFTLGWTIHPIKKHCPRGSTV